MKITGYGNASVKIEAEGQKLYFDPYMKELANPNEPKSWHVRRGRAFLEAEHVFLTHGHFDHLGSIAPLYRQQDVRVYCTKTPARTLERKGFPREKLCLIGHGDVIAIGGIKVTAYHTKHCRFNPGEIWNVIFRHHMFRHMGQMLKLLYLNASYPSGGECLLYEVAADGLRLQLLGSAGLDENVDYPTGADLLILPYQGRSDMAEYCFGIAERLCPKRILLDHYDDSFPPMTCLEDTKPFIEKMKQKYPGVPCGTLNEGETVELGA